MTNLRGTIEALASQFAASIVDALRTASIDELLSVTQGGLRRGRASGKADARLEALETGRRRGKGGRLGRRSTDEIEKMIESIVGLVIAHPEGMRAEQIRDALGCEAKELPRPLADALTAGRLRKQGQKRATTYFAGGGRTSKARAKKR